MWQRPIFNLANLLTLSRFVAGPLAAWFILRSRSPDGAAGAGWGVSLAVFLILGLGLLTDLFDGWVARRRRVVTDFGKIMDPVADSTFCLVILFALSASHRFRDHLPVWFPLAVLYREVAIQVLRRYGALTGQVLAARWSGKVKMFVQSLLLLGFTGFVALSDCGNGIPGFPGGWPEPVLGRAAFWTGLSIAVVNVASLAGYLRDVPALIADWRHPGPGRAP